MLPFTLLDKSDHDLVPVLNTWKSFNSPSATICVTTYQVGVEPLELRLFLVHIYEFLPYISNRLCGVCAPNPEWMRNSNSANITSFFE
jgi:hypothetical protein